MMIIFKNQAFQGRTVLRAQRVELLRHFLARVFTEFGDADVTVTGLRHLGVDAVQFDPGPFERHDDRLGRSLAQDSHLDGGALLAAHAPDGVRQGGGVDRHTVDGRDHVPRANPAAAADDPSSGATTTTSPSSIDTSMPTPEYSPDSRS